MNKFSQVFAGFSESYRDAHWQKCRHKTDPRSCGKAYLPKGEAQKFMDENRKPQCHIDGKSCDAEWTGEKDA